MQEIRKAFKTCFPTGMCVWKKKIYNEFYVMALTAETRKKFIK
jgi:hypothetical protein